MARIQNLIIHCSDSDFGDVSLIRQWHKQRGWKDIGYNAVILNGRRSAKDQKNPLEDGLLEMARGLDLSLSIDPNEVGAHAMGYNASSIGVCMIGSGKFSRNQFETLFHFCRLWQNIVPGISILGHYEVDKAGKTCPNFDVGKFRQIIYSEPFPPLIWDTLT